MPKVIMFTRPDGGVTFRHPAPNGRREGESEQEYLDRLIFDAKAERLTYDAGGNPVVLPPKAADEPVVVDASKKPKDRTLRAAWRRVGDRCVEDIEKAKEFAKTVPVTVDPDDTVEIIREKVKAARQT